MLSSKSALQNARVYISPKGKKYIKFNEYN